MLLITKTQFEILEIEEIWLSKTDFKTYMRWFKKKDFITFIKEILELIDFCEK